MDLKINPTSSLYGEITAPGSKSYSHRAFIAASLADGVSIIKNPLTSGDVGVTIDILKELKVNILKESKNTYIVERSDLSFKPVYKTLDCKNSGTSLRIFSALSLLIEGGLTLTGKFLQINRPILPLLDALKLLGGEYKSLKNQIHVKRKQKFCNHVEIRGDISSQFISALLIICPLLSCSNTDFIVITIKSPIVSYPYIRITMDVLNRFGINVQEKINAQKVVKYYLSCGQKFRSQRYEIPGDFSSAAFMMAAAVLSPETSKIIINNLNVNSPQGDKKLIEILQKMGANIKINQKKNQIIVNGNINEFPLKGIRIDCHEIPDLFPILSIIGAFVEGKTTLFNASNLRLKESDRIAIMARELSKMGVEVHEERDTLTIYKCASLKGSNINHENDHRIAMSCSIAALYANSSSLIKNIDVTKDSYPFFVKDLIELGANVQKIQ